MDRARSNYKRNNWIIARKNKQKVYITGIPKVKNIQELQVS